MADGHAAHSLVDSATLQRRRLHWSKESAGKSIGVDTADTFEKYY
jgi:hypothetical protein